MSETTPEPVNPAPQAGPQSAFETERLFAMLCYGLFLLALANGMTALIGVVLAYVRRGHAQGGIYQSHYDNLITVFWVSLVFGVLSVALLLNGIFTGLMLLAWLPGGGSGEEWHEGGWHTGWDRHAMGWPFFWWSLTSIPLLLLAGMIFAVWYLYRVLKGFIRALDEKPY